MSIKVYENDEIEWGGKKNEMIEICWQVYLYWVGLLNSEHWSVIIGENDDQTLYDPRSKESKDSYDDGGWTTWGVRWWAYKRAKAFWPSAQR